MASGVNKVLILGNVGQDPDIRHGGTGSAVCNLRIAVNERRKEGDGWKDAVEWFSVVTFGQTAENCAQYLKRGRTVFVEGRLQTREYQDKEGATKRVTEVVAFNVQFLSGEQPAQGGGGAKDALHRSGPYKRESPAATSNGRDDNGRFVDDDLPF